MEKRNIPAALIVRQEQITQDIEYALDRVTNHLHYLHSAQEMHLSPLGMMTRHDWVAYWIEEVEKTSKGYVEEVWRNV